MNTSEMQTWIDEIVAAELPDVLIGDRSPLVTADCLGAYELRGTRELVAREATARLREALEAAGGARDLYGAVDLAREEG